MMAFFDHQRAASIAKWKAILDQGTQIEVPETVVNNAARSLVIGTDAIRAGDQLNYSASNQYARQYSNESGDTMRSMLLWGQTQIARNSIKPLFVYRRPGIELHDGAFKLELLADYYFVTRDAALIQRAPATLAARDRSDPELARRRDRLAAEGGLLFRYPHAGALAQHQR